MTEEIRLVYQFDPVHDGQKVFREILSALANPGQIKDIGNQAEKFEGEYAVLLAAGCTLLDNEEKMYVEKNPRLADELHDLTLCREADLDKADYVFLSSEMNYGSMEQILKNVKHGTYADPQESVTLFLLCDGISGKDEMCLEGPGVDGQITLKINTYIKKTIEILRNINIEYPLGVDMIFADRSGNILGIPRLVRTV